MKKQYINADVKIIALDSSDIIATSGPGYGGEGKPSHNPSRFYVDFEEVEEEEI